MSVACGLARSEVSTWSWPLIRLTVTSDEMRFSGQWILRRWIGPWTLEASEIVRICPTRGGLLRNAIEIWHKPNERWVVFGSEVRRETLLATFRDLGYPVEA
jgi:hypothetical protein